MNYELLLQEKIKRELKDFRLQKLKLDKSKIFDSAYEILAYEDFAGLLGSIPLADDKIKKLLKCKNILGQLFELWFDDDNHVVDAMAEILNKFIEQI